MFILHTLVFFDYAINGAKKGDKKFFLERVSQPATETACRTLPMATNTDNVVKCMSVRQGVFELTKLLLAVALHILTNNVLFVYFEVLFRLVK